MHDYDTNWKRHNDQLLIDKLQTPETNSIAHTPARKINENKNIVGANQNPDSTIINKTPGPMWSRKLPQPHSPNDYN